GRPARVEGGPSHAGPGRHAVDGESGVALLDQDLQRSLKDRLVVAGVARSSRPPRGGGGRAVTAPGVRAAAGAPARLADAGHRLLAAPLQNYFTDPCVMISGELVSYSNDTSCNVTVCPKRSPRWRPQQPPRRGSTSTTRRSAARSLALRGSRPPAPGDR